MTCCFSGEEVPTEKLFVLYYPPSMAHHGWDQSVYAAAHAKHALAAAIETLRDFHSRYVVGKKLWGGVALAVAGLLLFVVWLATAVANWPQAGFAQKYLLPFAALMVTALGFQRLRAFLRRRRLWQTSGRSACTDAERIALDLAYVDNLSLALDLKILLRTLPVVICGEGAY